MKTAQVVFVVALLVLSISSILSVKGYYDDYHTGKVHDSNTFGPYEYLVPYMEKIGPQAIDPQFAIGPTGTVSVVYANADDHAVYYFDNATGSWSTPIKLMDEQYINFEEHAIATDGLGNVYILADGALGRYFTNRSGSWVENSVALGNFYYNIETNDAGDKVYIVSIELDTAPTPSDYEVKYVNLTYTGPTTYDSDTMTIDFSDGELYNPVYFLEMDINSTGHVHCVYKGFAEIYYFVINPDGTYTTPRAISQTNGESMSHCNWPSFDIDSDNNVHVIYTKTNYDSSNQWIPSESGLYYDVIEEGTDGSMATKISDHPGGKAYMATGIGDGKWHIGSYQSFDSVTQMEHIVNGQFFGEWNETFLTNFSYSQYVQGISVRDIEVNPVSNEPVILSTYRGHMELTSRIGGRWGDLIEFYAEIDSLEKTYPDNLMLTMDITNIDDRPFDLATFAQVFSLAEIEFENAGGNKQTVGTIAVDETLSLNWELHFTGKYEGQIHVSLLANDVIDDRGYAGVYFEIGISLSIPGYSIWILGLISIIAIGVIAKKSKK